MFTRILFVALLLINIGFFVWHQRFAPQPRDQFKPTEPGVTQLMKLSEIDPQSEQWTHKPTTEPEEVLNQTCFSVGPFTAQSELQPVVETLTPLVVKTRVRKITTTQEAGYWVYLPASENREEALQMGRQLAAAGVRDYYVVTSGQHENTVSLGLYREQANADKRIAELARKGFQVLKEVRIEQWPEFWLDYSATQEQIGALPDLKASNPDIQQNEVICQK